MQPNGEASPRSGGAPCPSAPSLKGGTHSTNAVDPGAFKGTERNGDMVILKFERLNLVQPRCGAIGIAYCLSELVE